MIHPATIAVPARIEGVDPYAASGVALTRDAAHIVMASLRRDAFDMEQRGGAANTAQAEQNRTLAQHILHSIAV